MIEERKKKTRLRYLKSRAEETEGERQKRLVRDRARLVAHRMKIITTETETERRERLKKYRMRNEEQKQKRLDAQKKCGLERSNPSLVLGTPSTRPYRLRSTAVESADSDGEFFIF